MPKLQRNGGAPWESSQQRVATSISTPPRLGHLNHVDGLTLDQVKQICTGIFAVETLDILRIPQIPYDPIGIRIAQNDLLPRRDILWYLTYDILWKIPGIFSLIADQFWPNPGHRHITQAQTPAVRSCTAGKTLTLPLAQSVFFGPPTISTGSQHPVLKLLKPMFLLCVVLQVNQDILHDCMTFNISSVQIMVLHVVYHAVRPCWKGLCSRLFCLVSPRCVHSFNIFQLFFIGFTMLSHGFPMFLSMFWTSNPSYPSFWPLAVQLFAQDWTPGLRGVHAPGLPQARLRDVELLLTSSLKYVELILYIYTC